MWPTKFRFTLFVDFILGHLHNLKQLLVPLAGEYLIKIFVKALKAIMRRFMALYGTVSNNRPLLF